MYNSNHTVVTRTKHHRTSAHCIFNWNTSVVIPQRVKPPRSSAVPIRSRVQLKCDGTLWRREGKWKGNWRMEWVASTLHTTSEHAVSSITTPDAHISAASGRLNWRDCRFEWTHPFRRKTQSGFCACAITFQTQPAFLSPLRSWHSSGICMSPPHTGWLMNSYCPELLMRVFTATDHVSLDAFYRILARLRWIWFLLGSYKKIRTPWGYDFEDLGLGWSIILSGSWRDGVGGGGGGMCAS